MAIFWFSFFLIRGIGYYQQLREKQSVAERLETELANAKISALRMQLNPHFLFNTMNSISSLMRIDIDAADSMLEQLGSLLRMTLERGDVQLVPLHEEIEFVETYLSMQDQRYAGRFRRTMSIRAELHDALVPAMILQPIVENAFAHGISKLDRDGELAIEAFEEGGRLMVRITNSGKGAAARPGQEWSRARRRTHEREKSIAIALRRELRIFDSRDRFEPRASHDLAATADSNKLYRKSHKVWCRMIRAVIADDEVLARQKIRQLLRQDTDIEIVGESASALETIELVRATTPELLFLDIRMPGMDGFDVVGALSSQGQVPPPRVIFTTRIRPIRSARVRGQCRRLPCSSHLRTRG